MQNNIVTPWYFRLERTRAYLERAGRYPRKASQLKSGKEHVRDRSDRVPERPCSEFYRDENDLVRAVHSGIKMMSERYILAGRALQELRDGPKRGMSQKDWDTWLRKEFRISNSTFTKWAKLAEFDKAIGPQADGVFPNGNTIWENLPPRWTSQYEIVHKLSIDEVLGATTQTELMPPLITPLSTGA